jgi:hypothetical protein
LNLRGFLSKEGFNTSDVKRSVFGDGVT